MLQRACELLSDAVGRGTVLWLTGAGISAESGIPTFRGPEGYWKVGSRHYQPQELATRASFLCMPKEVWAWYLYRRGVCRAASPNAAHRALASLERSADDRFALVTQNVDGLHLRAGNTLARTHQIHGNLDWMRCASACGEPPVPVPDQVTTQWEKGRTPTTQEWALLRCRCGDMARPHVLWFDESYDEVHFRYRTSLRAAEEATAVVVVGTTGATTLPMKIGWTAVQKGTPLVVVNPEPNPFGHLVDRSGNGFFLEGTAGALVPALAQACA